VKNLLVQGVEIRDGSLDQVLCRGNVGNVDFATPYRERQRAFKAGHACIPFGARPSRFDFTFIGAGLTLPLQEKRVVHVPPTTESSATPAALAQ